MIQRRLVFLSSVFVVLAVGFAACGGSNSPSGRQQRFRGETTPLVGAGSTLSRR